MMKKTIYLVALLAGGFALVIAAQWWPRTIHPHPGPALMQLMSVQLAVTAYEADVGRLPDDVQDLFSEASSTNWRGPYLKSETELLDPWGHTIRYRTIDQHGVTVSRSETGYMVSSGGTDTWHTFEIRSAGPDGVLGTADDIIR